MEYLLQRLGGQEEARKVVGACLLQCPQLLTVQRAQVEAAVGFLDFLDLSTEEVCTYSPASIHPYVCACDCTSVFNRASTCTAC